MDKELQKYGLDDVIQYETEAYFGDEADEIERTLKNLELLYAVKASNAEAERSDKELNWQIAFGVADRVGGALKWIGSTLVVVTLYREGLEFEKEGTICSTFVKDLAKNSTSILRFIK
jgi:NhaP-type Na+/H+ and K+/H+ antiporter